MSKINAFGPVNGYNGYMFTYLYIKTDNAWNVKYWRLRGRSRNYIFAELLKYMTGHKLQILCTMCHYETILVGNDNTDNYLLWQNNHKRLKEGRGGGVIIALIFKY